ncbi:MAG: ABC transporter ATP-binding protein, partial [Oscillospiraceae bacterium]|nr:ABC transporter ATP-binding protein [Oscillospiraceae bacterium]
MRKVALLELKDLSICYETSEETVQAVNNVSFSIEPGETLGLVGETGAGKSTTAYGILRILPESTGRYRGGQILFEGKDLVSLPESEMRHIRGNQISMIFQDPMTALNPVIRVVDQIAEAIAQHSDVSPAQAVQRASEMLEVVGIPAARGVEYPHQFSGGMKQRVIIAMALACSPKLLLADEPTTALDVTIQAQVLRLMNDLKKTYNTAMLLITHDLGVVAESCDRVAIMYASEIVEYGSLEDIFDSPMHPYTIGLFQSIPSLDKTVKRLTPIHGLMPDPANLPQGCNFAPRCPHGKRQHCP